METPQVDDAVLITRIAHGDAQALEALYDRYSRLVFSIALTVVGNRATAEEISLDAFMRVWRAAASYDQSRGKVSTWIVSIARHHAIDVLRRTRSRPDADAFELDLFSQAKDGDAPNPETETELDSEREAVRAALRELPPEQRQALALAYFRGYSHQEIAERLQQPLGTVKSRIRLAMIRLRTLLSDETSSGDTSNSRGRT